MARRIILNPVLIEDDAEFESWLEQSLSDGVPVGQLLQIAAQRDARRPAQPAPGFGATG